jgi:membrane dipeptidase
MLHMTGSAQLGGDVRRLAGYHRLGVRSLHFSRDAAGGSEDPGDDDAGLTPFGRDVVREMDGLEMPIDVSHASDKAFWEILECSRGKVYASHSNCRALCAARRNLTDEMIRAVADRDGVVGMHFSSGLCDAVHDRASNACLKPYLEDVNRLLDDLRRQHPDPWEFQKAFLDPAVNPGFAPDTYDRFGFPPVLPFTRMVDHIDHVCALVGARHVAIGSDWNGGRTSMQGLEHIGCMPNLTRELAVRGHGAREIRNILGGNWLRLFA